MNLNIVPLLKIIFGFSATEVANIVALNIKKLKHCNCQYCSQQKKKPG
jgi:hypothetical protein